VWWVLQLFGFYSLPLKIIQLKEKIQCAVNSVGRTRPQRDWRVEQVKFGIGAGAGKFCLRGIR